MSTVDLHFLGPVRRPAGLATKATVPLPEPPTLAGLVAALGFTAEDEARLHFMVDGRRVVRDHPLSAGQRVTIFLPLGGG